MRKVSGVGINDASYTTSKYERTQEGKKVLVWRCPIYAMWCNMINRCYRDEFTTYRDVTVCEEWLKFSSFKEWIGDRDVTGLTLDKDILDPWNDEYSPDKCVLVANKINTLIIESRRNNSPTPNVRFRNNKYEAQVRDGSKLLTKRFNDIRSANLWWISVKLELIDSFDLDEYLKSKLRGRYFFFLATNILV